MALPGSELRLLYVIDSLAHGGAEQSLASLAPHYRRLGIALDVVVLEERPGLREDIQSAGSRVTAVAAGGRAGRLREISALLETRRPMLVHTTLFESDLIGRLAARLQGVPVVSSLVNEAYGPEHRREQGVRITRLLGAQLLDAATARLAVRVHAVSQQVRTLMSQRLHYPAPRIDVVHRGRDRDALGWRTPHRRDRARAQLGVRRDELVVLAVARHEPAKALDTLVTAFARVRRVLPDSRLLIAGREGNATSVIMSAIQATGLGAGVVLLGARDDVPDLLCAADVFVLSSLREGLPGAVIEAMAMQVPIVASRIPHVLEVTGAAGAELVTPGDVGALADGILRTVENPALALERVDVASQQFADSFTIERAATGMLEFYERSLAQAH